MLKPLLPLGPSGPPLAFWAGARDIWRIENQSIVRNPSLRDAMQSLRVAAVSLNNELGKRDQTLPRIEQFCEQAVAERAELVVFPDLVVHGPLVKDQIVS